MMLVHWRVLVRDINTMRELVEAIIRGEGREWMDEWNDEDGTDEDPDDDEDDESDD